MGFSSPDVRILIPPQARRGYGTRFRRQQIMPFSECREKAARRFGLDLAAQRGAAGLQGNSMRIIPQPHWPFTKMTIRVRRTVNLGRKT
jgi:hypothetical protein